jgi:threonine/homoserine/homoserine lactone efflux protein
MAVMAMTPGPANLASVAIGVERGRSAALRAVAGMNLASLLWFGAAGLGLGAFVSAFPQVFRAVAIFGAAYVAWLGVKALMQGARRADKAAGFGAARPRRFQSDLLDGFAVQIANPKAVLFFTAVLPPFLDPARPLLPQLALFAVAMIGLDVLAMSAYGLGGAVLSRRMTEPRFRRGFSVFTGALLLAAAALIVARL